MTETGDGGTYRCECECGRVGCVSRLPKPRGRTRYQHGTAHGYQMGCRCEPCTLASSERTQIQRKRRNAESMAGAKKHRQEWTGPELEIATREDLTAYQAAVMLGRTMKAVKVARTKCRTDPKYAALLSAPASTSTVPQGTRAAVGAS